MKVVGCFLEYQGKFVMLRRLSHKPDGDGWGLPAGKVDSDESVETAALRELYEETGYQATSDQLEYLNEHRFFMPSGAVNDFIMYRIVTHTPHDVILETSSHSAFRWVSPEEAYAIPDLMFGMHQVFRCAGLIDPRSTADA